MFFYNSQYLHSKIWVNSYVCARHASNLHSPTGAGITTEQLHRWELQWVAVWRPRSSARSPSWWKQSWAMKAPRTPCPAGQLLLVPILLLAPFPPPCPTRQCLSVTRLCLSQPWRSPLPSLQGTVVTSRTGPCHSALHFHCSMADARTV